MTDLLELETRLNTMIASGKVLEALTEFFSDDAVFQEGTAKPRVGKKANQEFLSGFLKSLKAFNGAKLHSQSVGKDISFSEWTFDMVGADGPIVWNEVFKREWKNGKVVSERYYNAGA
jgi:hypothetical protein